MRSEPPSTTTADHVTPPSTELPASICDSRPMGWRHSWKSGTRTPGCPNLPSPVWLTRAAVASCWLIPWPSAGAGSCPNRAEARSCGRWWRVEAWPRRTRHPEGDHAGGDHRHPPAHPAFPVQEDADEARLEEEGGQCLQADHRSQDRADRPGVITPVEAELEGRHDARHGPEREADREDLAPEPEHLKVQRITGPVVGAVADDQEDRQADRQRREGHVEPRRSGELPAGQVYE